MGDEDLLEIIGNSKNVAKLQKHFKKMFAGVSSILLNEDNTEVLGISSREGEEIFYKTPVSITEHPKINEWLTLVEKEMRVTLAKLLAESVTEVTAFNKGTAVDLSQYIDWIDRYQVRVVDAGVWWSRLKNGFHWSDTCRAPVGNFDSTSTRLLPLHRPSWWSCPPRSPGLRTSSRL